MLEIMAYKRDDHSQILLCNRLRQAIHNGELERVRMCIEQGVDLNRQYYSEMYPLELACCHGHEEVMEELLRAGANPNHVSVWCEDSYSSQALPVMLMAAERHVLTLSMMRSLILNGAEVNFKGLRGMTILHYLARGQFNDTDDNILFAVKLVLANGACLYDRDRDGHTPLYEACARGNMDLAKLFIDKGCDVNSEIGHKKLLRAPADSSNIDLFDVLLNAGARRHLTHEVLLKPCEQNDHAMIARILDTCDVDINLAIDRYERPTILSDACKNYRITSETVRLLLDRGADIRAVSNTGDTALHYAVTQCNCNKILQLLSYNAPLNIENNENQTPLAKLIQSFINDYSGSHQHTHAQVRRYYAALYQASLLAFKMLVAAGATITADVQHKLNQFHITHPEAEMPDYKSSCIESLKEMCRFVLRGTIPVPVDVSLRKLPIPKLLQEYLNFPEFDQLVDENNIYLKILIRYGVDVPESTCCPADVPALSTDTRQSYLRTGICTSCQLFAPAIFIV